METFNPVSARAARCSSPVGAALHSFAKMFLSAAALASLGCVRLLSGEFELGQVEREIIWITLQPGEVVYGPSDHLSTNKLDHLLTISQGPITCGQYSSFLKETGHPAPRFATGPAEFRDQFTWRGQDPPSGRESWPVTFVTKDDAQAYCQWLGKKAGRTYRLPTEDELTYSLAGAAADGRGCTSVKMGQLDVAWWGIGPVGGTNQITSRVGLQCFPLALLEWTSRDWVQCGGWGQRATDGQTYVLGMQGPGEVLGVFGFRIVAETSPGR